MTHSPRYIELDNPDTVAPDDDDLLPKVAGGELHHVSVGVGVHGEQTKQGSRDFDRTCFFTTDQVPGDELLFVTVTDIVV